MIYFYVSILVEIAFFIGIAHIIIRWLAQDKRSNLVGYFILYVIALVITQQSGLMTLHYFLYWMVPCFGTLFVLLHQEQLQKNFVTITHGNQEKVFSADNIDFITTILQIGLYNSMRKKNSVFIIEGNEDLSLLMHATIPLNIPLQKELIESICESSFYNEHTAIWLHYAGIAKGINSSLIQSAHVYDRKGIINTAIDDVCNKTDCFVLLCDINGLWTFKNNNQTHQMVSTAHIQKLSKQKIELLVQQRSFSYVRSQATDTQKTVS